MKQVILLIIVSLVVVSANAQQHQHQDQQAGADCCTNKSSQQSHDHSGQGNGKMMGMMNNEQMMAMHKHMSEMQDIMKQLKEEVDPHAFEELMAKHQGQMRKGMEMMMHGSMMGKDMSAINMDEQTKMMGMHMEMMKGMMEQMMQHGEMMKKPKE